MTSGKRIVTNTIFMTMSSVLNMAISIGTTAIIARSIGPELYGRYTFGLSYILFLSALANFGIESLFIREAARDRKNIDLILDIIPLKAILALFTIVAVIVSAHALNYPDETIRVIYVLCAGLFFQVINESLNALFQSQEKLYINALLSVIFRILTAIVIVVSVYSGTGFWGIVSAFVIGHAASSVAMVAFAHRELGSLRLRFQPKLWIGLVRQGIPFYASALLTMIYHKINILMLSKMVSEQNIGLYMAAIALVEGLYFIPTALNSSIYPAFSRMYGNSLEALNKTYQKMTKYILVLTVGATFGTLLVAKDVILTIYGPQFLDSIPVLQVYILFWVFTFFAQILSSLLFSVHMESIQVKVMAGACIINIVLSFLFIREYGIIGAAYASVLTEFFVVIAIMAVLWQHRLRYVLDFNVLRLVVNVIAMVFTVRYLLIFNMVLAIIGGAAVYLVLLFVVGVFDAEDKLYIKAVIGK
ncbi:MAG: flippase [Candidatus Manganitrophus sp.]|nr:flippase [Candidatus Manganitrophus sp.]MDC4226044.1 flippase [Candidatus Manganitrophus sp.]WDT72701.1 MAG: flippase [Candidatus Manganitrophus sp.]WDT79833.1 MAG: flippase [Candidatus Manganitrophus sp.]